MAFHREPAKSWFEYLCNPLIKIKKKLNRFRFFFTHPYPGPFPLSRRFKGADNPTHPPCPALLGLSPQKPGERRGWNPEIFRARG
jgi:hypothetical protein